MNMCNEMMRRSSKEMIPVREDGSLDVTFIQKLPFEDFCEVKNKLAHEQEAQLYDAQPQKHVGTVKGVLVDYTMDDEIDWGFGFDAKKILDRMRERILRFHK